MDDIARKAQIRKTFDTVAEGYGGAGMDFFHRAASHLPSLFALRGDEQVLDVATGTGIAAAALAPHVPRGRVVGIDFSENMLAQARARARATGAGIGQIAFCAMDMEAMAFEDACFDAANCSFGLFFLQDMARALGHIVSKVKRGGQVVTCSFHEGAFEPNVDLFLERIQRYGVSPPDFSWKRLCLDAHYRDLYAQAGLSDVRTEQRDVGYFLKDADAWWRLIWYAGFRGFVAQLDEADLAHFKQAHLAEIRRLDTGRGIPLEVTALYASGRVS